MTVCKLCLKAASEVGGLRQSHIIPRYMLVAVKENGLSMLFDKNKSKPRKGQFDWKEEMLCTGCEGIMKRYEDYLHLLLHKRKRPNLLHEDVRREIIYGSNNMVALGLISIFWRSCHSQLPEFRSTVLPGYLLEDFRNYILKNEIPTNWDKQLTIKIIKLINPAGSAFKAVMAPQFRLSEISCEFIFVASEYFFSIAFAEKNDNSRRYFLNSGSYIVRVLKMPFILLPELADIIGKKD